MVCTDFPVIVIVIIGIIRSRSERGGTRRDTDKEERARHRGEKFKVSEPSARVSDQATHSGLTEPPRSLLHGPVPFTKWQYNKPLNP